MAQPKEEWLQAIATKAKVEVSKVEGVLSAHQIQPSPLVAQPRRLVLRDIEFSGEKDGVADAGDFPFHGQTLITACGPCFLNTISGASRRSSRSYDG